MLTTNVGGRERFGANEDASAPSARLGSCSFFPNLYRSRANAGQISACGFWAVWFCNGDKLWLVSDSFLLLLRFEDKWMSLVDHTTPYSVLRTEVLSSNSLFCVIVSPTVSVSVPT